MKYPILFFLLTCAPLLSRGQDSINPYNIAQHCNIVLHHTDVYYNPFDPPSDTDTRAGLCTMANKILDSNGRFENWPGYQPVTHGTFLYQWAPHGVPLANRPWQRLFTARDKWDGSHSDIVAGGPDDTVTISKNEDVDFRASGTIKLENGFHVMPGAFFHAYQEPHWGPVILSDNFDSINRAQWYVDNGSNAESGGIQCDYDTNVVIDTDYEATDGKALDIMLRENLDTCNCRQLKYSWTDTCNGTFSSDTIKHKSLFSSAMVRACPWPMADRTASVPDSMAYQHTPFGKYEIREKTPHTLHHINNWLFGSFEIDMNEESANDTATVQPSVHYRVHNGPFKGWFGKKPDSIVIFVSPNADWSLFNQPDMIYIDNFAYDVKLDIAGGHHKDTVVGTAGTGADGVTGGIRNWPSSLKNSRDTFSFYYSKAETCIADTVPWRISQDPASHQWRIFSAPYHIVSPVDSSRFTKDYQPYQITLRAKIDTIHGDTTAITLHCHWAKWLNSSGDTGRLWMDDYDTGGTYVHSYSEAYPYQFSNGLFDYQAPSIPYEWGDSANYRYHTIAVEILPNELRLLYDSNVVLRVPDRLIPVGYPQYDLLKNMDRTPLQFYIGELDLNANSNPSFDPFGNDSIPGDHSMTYLWRHMFEHGALYNWAGFWPYHGQPTAHKRIDYVRVWDVPAGTIIPNFPH